MPTNGKPDQLSTGAEAPISASADHAVSNSGLDLIRNEAYVFGTGLEKSWGAAVSDFGKALHDPATLEKVAVSTVVGLGIGYLAGRTGTLGMLGRGVGTAAGISFLWDGVKPFTQAFDMTLHAKTQGDLNKASDVFGNAFGAFAADTVIQTPGAILGGKLGSSIAESGALRSLKLRGTSVPTSETVGLSGAGETVGTGGVRSFLSALKPNRSPVDNLGMRLASDLQGGSAHFTPAGDASTARGAADAAPPQAERVDATDKTSDVSAASPNTFGYRFVEIKPTDPSVPQFDMSVGISDPAIAGDTTSLAARTGRKGVTSLALGAQYMPKTELPAEGSTIAIADRTPDSLTALATMANRVQGRKVTANIVSAVAQKGEGTVDPESVLAYKAIAHTTEQPLKLGEQLRFIRAVLDRSAANTDIESRATAYDIAHAPKPEAKPEPVRNAYVGRLNSDLYLDYKPVNDKVPSDFDYAIGMREHPGVRSAQIIDRQGGRGIVQVALDMPDEELPKPGSSVALSQIDTQRATAAAIIENRISGVQMRRPLLNLILRGGADTARGDVADNADIVSAYQAIDGIANNPLYPQAARIAAIKQLLSTDIPAGQLRSINAEHGFFRSSEQPFKYVRTTVYKPKPFDYGVEITEPSLLKGQPNLDHHAAGSSADMPSASEQALTVTDDQLPRQGARVALQKPDADALTAIATLANRVSGDPVNSRLVEAIGRHDRGIETDPTGKPYSDLTNQIATIRSISRNSNITIDQRIAGIRAVLSDRVKPSVMEGFGRRFAQNQWASELHAEKTSTVQTIIPGELVRVDSPRENWFSSRQVGLDQAPVAFLVARDDAGQHLQVVAKNDLPNVDDLNGAIAALNRLDQNETWVGHSYMFVTKRDSSLDPETVLDVLKYFLHPTNPEVKTALANRQYDLAARLAGFSPPGSQAR